MDWGVVVLAAQMVVGAVSMGAESAGIRFYVGTYTRKGSEGIYMTVLDRATGELSAPVLAARSTNPSFLAIHPNRRFLYAVGERSNFEGRKEGSVAAFGIDAETGLLTQIGEEGAGGTGPCHLALDPSGRTLIVANYVSGSVGVLSVGADGRLGESTQSIQHKGSGPNERRQAGPHAHGVTLDATGKLALVCDLGIDRVMIYRVDTDTARLTAHGPACAVTPPGSGPRHAAFSRDGRYLFVLNELDATVTSYAWDIATGTPELLKTIGALPADFNERNTAAEIAVHPNGRYVYTSNRGHDSIAVFALDGATGKLALKQHRSCGGKTPRCFALDPSGRFLLVANQNSGNVVAYRVDPATGRLAPTGSEIAVPLAVCVLPFP